jgi:hypothetical protein
MLARLVVGSDGRANRDTTILRDLRCHVSDATDVDVAILSAEPEPSAERLSYLVAVEHLDAQATIAQLGSDPLADRRFPGAREAGEPDGQTAHEATGAARA